MRADELHRSVTLQVTLLGILMLGAWSGACLSPVRYGDPDGVGPDAGDTERPGCGAQGESCCAQPLAACDGDLVCEAASQQCLHRTRRTCTSDTECPSDEICCTAGFLGMCAAVEPQNCPMVDLAVELPELNTLYLSEWTAGDDPGADACVFERQCVTGPGLRRLLRFPARVTNVGSVDLVLGSPDTSSGFELAECDGQRHVESFLSYQLVNAESEVVSASHVPALCEPPATAPFVSPFSCEFQGLWSGFSQNYTPTRFSDGVFRDSPCQWVDVTDLAPGAYSLRISVNPNRVVRESNLTNNTGDLRVELPRLDPTQECPTPENPLLGGECGWSLEPFQSRSGATPCIPEEPLQVACQRCLGSPMLRVCDGSVACNAAAAAAIANGCYDEFSPLSFICPGSGSYSVWTGSEIPGVLAACDPAPAGAPDAGVNGAL